MKPEISWEMLPVPLTPEEKAKLADDADALTEKLEDLEATKRSLPKQIDTVKESLYEISQKRRTGTKMQQVECEERPDFEARVVRLVRLDTLDVVRERSISAKDRQANLFTNERGLPDAGTANQALSEVAATNQTEEDSQANVLHFFGQQERSGDELAKLKTPLDVYVSQEELAQFAKTECAKNLPKKKCTISKTFQLGEELYVCTSFMRAGEQIESLLAYRLVEREKFTDAIAGFEDTRTTGNLHGLIVWQRGWEYVLTGPPIIFRDKANLPPEESGTVELERFESIEAEATQGKPVQTERNQLDLAEWAEDAATSLITEGKGGIKRIYVDGNPYVITGYMSSKDGVEEVYAHAVLPVSIVGEENAVTYSERSQAYYAGGIPTGPMSYAGIKINCGNKKKPDWWVMLGEQVTFTVAPRNAAPVTRKPTLDEISNYLIVHSETGEVPNLASHARKLQLSGAKDAEVMAWLEQIEKEDYPEAEAEDDFTAEICSECDRIDGAHDVNCSQHPDYIAPAPGKPKKPRDLPSGWVFDSTLEEGFRAIKGTKRTLMFNKRVECIVAAHELEKGMG